mgnify:CR=1 FL=1
MDLSPEAELPFLPTVAPKRPMLAADAPPPDQLRFPYLVSPKVDGIRATRWGGRLYSRSLKLIPNKHIQSLSYAANLPAPFDGELVVGSATGEGVFNRTTSGVMSRDEAPAFTWYVFDYVPISEVQRHVFQGRYNRLTQYADEIERHAPWIKVLRHIMVHNIEQLLRAEQNAINLGFEGLMGRDPTGPYKHGRSTVLEGWLYKFKRFVSDEALVIGYIEEMHNTNEATINELGYTKRSSHAGGMVGKGTLGALVCKNLAGAEFNIGNGFTADQRRQLWAIRDQLVGRIAKFKRFPIGEKDKPRFPVWEGFRDLRDMG